MKTTITLCLVLILALSFRGFAQQFIPLNAHAPASTAVAKNRGMSEMVAKEIDETYLEGRIIGIGGASDITEAKTRGGNLSLGTHLLFRGSDPKSHFNRHAVYAFWNARPGNTDDTAVVARTYLFPEIGKRDLTLGYEWLIQLGGDHSYVDFIPTLEVSCTRNTLTPEEGDPVKFNAYNFMLGTDFKVATSFKIGEDEKMFGLSARPYYQLITVDPKDFNTRNDMLKEDDLPPTFHTLGVYFTLQLAELGLFGNYRRILNNSDQINSKDLKEGVFVLGAVISPSIFHFKGSKNDD